MAPTGSRLLTLFLGTASLVGALGILVVGLVPFDFFRPNSAKWEEAGPGLRFERRSIAYTRSALDLGQLIPSQTLSLEIWLEAEEHREHGTARVLTLHDGTATPPMILDQYQDTLVVRSKRTNPTADEPYRGLSRRGLLPPNRRTFFTLTSGVSEGTALYSDGERIGLHARYPIVADASGFAGRLILGASPRGDGQWAGRMYGLAIYDRVLSPEEVERNWLRVRNAGMRSLKGTRGLLALYPFDDGAGRRIRNIGAHDGFGDIEIPGRFHPLTHAEFLRAGLPSLLEREWNLSDMAANFAGFIPMGLLLALFLRRSVPTSRSVCWVGALLGGLALSLTVELLQAYLPARSSSLTDLCFNTLGTLAGALLSTRSASFQRL